MSPGRLGPRSGATARSRGLLIYRAAVVVIVIVVIVMVP